MCSGIGIVRSVYLLIAILAIYLTTSSCSDQGKINPTLQQPHASSLERALKELDDTAVPEGADPLVFDSLRHELRTSLSAKASSDLEPGPPVNDSSQPQLSWDETRGTLIWYYSNSGDYDQNGLVGVSDLTPLGVHYGKAADIASRSVIDELSRGPGSSPFGLAPVESVIDGNADGQVGISDITPIGQNYNAMVAGYHIYAGTEGSDYPAGNSTASSLTPIAEVPFSEALGTASIGRLHFSYTIPSPVSGNTYWVRPFYQGVEGTPSNTAGPGLTYAQGSLALTGISPVTAEPGELVWLEFSRPIGDEIEELTLIVNGIDEVEVPLTNLAVNQYMVGTAAPLLAPGIVTYEVFQDGSSLGSVQLTLHTPTTTLDESTANVELEAFATRLDATMVGYFEELAAADSEFNYSQAMSDLDDMNATLDGMIELFFDQLTALSPEEQIAVLAYLENSGYFDLLAGFGANLHSSSRTASCLCEANWKNLSLDMWSAATTNNAFVMDMVSFSVAIATLGSTVPALVVAKVMLSVFDNVIDTFIPTDLYELRVTSERRMLESGRDKQLVVEGRFAAENTTAAGTIGGMIDTALAGLSLPEADKVRVISALKNDLHSKVGGRLILELWDGVLTPVDDPDDPCNGRIGGDWIRLDLQLYSSSDWDELSNKVRYNDYLAWMGNYPGAESPHPGQVVTIQPFLGEVRIEQNKDVIHFGHNGKYDVTIWAFTFNDPQSVGYLWSETRMKDITLDVPFWVGRYGDWANITLGPDESNDEMNSFAWIADGRPVVLYQGWFSNHVTHAQDAACSIWSPPVQVLDDIAILDFAVINGLPTVFYKDNTFRLLQADDELGSSWPDEGIEVAKTMRCSGTHTGETSDRKLIDASGGFLANGVEAGCYVELVYTGTIVEITGVVDDTELRTYALPEGETFHSGAMYKIYLNDVRQSSRRRFGTSGGVPVITYWEYAADGYSDTYFVSAKDQAGWEWNEPVLVGSDPGDRWPVQDIGGMPAYCCESLTEGIYYRCATDSAGLNWGSSHKVSNAGTWINDFNEVMEAPAILIDGTVDLPPGSDVLDVDALFYTIADDAAGSGWSGLYEVARGGESLSSRFMGDASLAVIHGLPAVAFYHKAFDLAYIPATDPTGVSWGKAEIVDKGRAENIVLLETGSAPGICYLDPLGDNMRFSMPDL